MKERQESVCQVYTFLLIHSSGMNQNCFHHEIMYLYLQINSNSLKDLGFRNDSLYLKETWQNTCSCFFNKRQGFLNLVNKIPLHFSF